MNRVEKLVAEMKPQFRCRGSQCFSRTIPIVCNFASLPANTLMPGETDLAAAAWVFEHRQWAGKFTGNLPMLDTMFLPLESSRRIVGVMGVRIERDAPPTIHERNLLEAFARQAAVTLGPPTFSGNSLKRRKWWPPRNVWEKPFLTQCPMKFARLLQSVKPQQNDLEDF